ncbi:MAG: uracil-DNA glycosylase [Pseudomonadota bacterium]
MFGINEKVNCISCIYYYITWDNNFPKGCKLFEIKSRRMPSDVVREATGESCRNYAEKRKPGTGRVT